VRPGRVLVDGIVVHGSVKAKQSARTGSDEVVELAKGDRLESGAEVLEARDCLMTVENVLERSLLVEIGTQIKLAQNQEQGAESSVQTLCRTVASLFVRGVVVLSCLTMAVWTLLLLLGVTAVETCDVCWVVERGIGVLVASCPCALGLAVPSVIAIVLNLATKSGVLIKNNAVFERIKRAKRIAFDKTGTLFTRIDRIEDHRTLSKAFEEAKCWEMVAVV
jgi:Cu+-exporting ATPase